MYGIFYVTLLTLKIFRQLLDFWEISASLSKGYIH